jgi:uncharacterized membrane-anchored protein YjiN (DUF445 family)
VQKTCTTCGETKPKKEFHRVLTLAQSRAVLKKPNLTTRHTLYSTLCRDCRNQRKRRTPLSIKEIHNKITTGDIHQVIGENLIKQKREAIPRKRSKVMKEYWQKKRTLWQDELKANLQKQVTTYASRYYSYKNNMPEDATPAQHALLDQHRYNYTEAQRIRQDLIDRVKAGEVVEVCTQINELIKRRKVGAL